MPGKVTRSKYIYRSGAPTSIPTSSLDILSAIDLKRVYDLRSTQELEKLAAQMPVTELPGVTRVFAPVFRDEDYSPERIAARYQNYSADGGPGGFVKAYGDILEAAAESGSFRTAFEHILLRPNESFLVHCTAGKDRTGVLVALILGVAGVDRERIAEEYALTEMGLGEWRKIIVGHLMREEGTGMSREGVERMVGARKENMSAMLEMIQERYGGAVGYVKGRLGFSDKEVDVIRSHLIEDAIPYSTAR
jgi:protein tyrosine/serine phosphatase